MTLLFSNLSPLKQEMPTYPETFKDLLRNSDLVNIATGYFSTDSAVDLKTIVEVNKGPKIELCIGMHYFDGMSPVQLDALVSLNKSLIGNNLGQVHMVTTFPFHGKIASFSKTSTVLGSIMGSSNLTNIIDGQRQYEVDCLFNDSDYANKLNDFVKQLIRVSATPLNQLDIQPTIPENELLKDQLGVKKLSKHELDQVKQRLSKLTFEIPLKGDESQKSGLNATFGEGRRNTQGFIIPRPWYEVELIVPKHITKQSGYPQAKKNDASFDVITDDGWQFRCKVSGDFSKNFRSEDDLKTLGKWLKGRLENAGVLKPSERVTDHTLTRYGRHSIQLTKLVDSDNWFIDFGVNK
jgi:hypothetical protein